MKDKIIESIFPQFIFNHLQMTQTQEIITWVGFGKFTNGYEGKTVDMRGCMSWGKFPKP